MRIGILAVFIASLFDACNTDPGKGDDTGPVDGDDGDDGGDTDTDDTDDTDDTEDSGIDEISGAITGSVTVELYTTGPDGEREELDWNDSRHYDASTGMVSFPFGNIFVGAYYSDDGGHDRYIGSTVINAPGTGPNSYELDWEMPENGEDVYVYAALDRWGDTIVNSDDPRGVYPMPLELNDGDTITGIDITILTPELVTGGGGCGGGGSAIEISGDILITLNYSSGGAAAMLVSTNGAGPYHWNITEPTADGTGASASYAMASCPNYGSMNLVGAWDNNQDGMYAPDDVWGAYAPVTDVDGNPIDVQGSNLTGHDIQIPLGDQAGVSVVPFVRLAGTVSMGDGTAFDSLPAGSTLYVAALRYRPNTGININSASYYDIVEVPWADLTGQSSVDFNLIVPAETITYLWAYADEDVDGLVNEPGEHITSGGEDANGRLNTGTSNRTGIDLRLNTVL